MKKAFLLIVITFLIFSCKKKDEENNDPPPATPWNVQLDRSQEDWWFGDIEITSNAIYVLGYTMHPSGFSNKTLIYKSADGGLSWNTLGYDDDLSFRGIHFMNNDIGLLAGYRLTSKSIDAGVNWDTTSTGLLNFDSFVSLDNGRIFGYGTGVYISEDTAKTWHSAIPVSHSYNTMDFVDNSVGYTANTVGKLYQTLDGGDSWQLISDLGNLMLYFELDFIDRHNGIALIAFQYSPHAEPEMGLYYTHDEGLNWTELTVENHGIILNTTSCCVLKSSNEIYLGAVNGIFYSNDFGASWINQYSAFGNSWIVDIKFQNGVGIATTGMGVILKY